MNDKTAKVLARWDAEGEVWVATSYDIPGLVVAGRNEDELVDKIQLVALDLLEANVGDHEFISFVVEYVREDITRRPLKKAA